MGNGMLAAAGAVSLALVSLAISPAGRADSHASGDGLARGEQLYHQLCHSCHGVYGRGDGPVAGQLSRRPPDFTRPELLAGRSDAQVVASLRRASAEGSRHTPMAVSEVVSASALQEAIAYMRTLAVPGEHVSVKAGRDLYQNFCWMCHGLEGNGKGPAAAKLPGTQPRDFSSPEFRIEGREAELHRIISSGAAATMHGSEYMLEWGNKISAQQIDDVIAYLKTFKSRGSTGAAP